MIEILKSPEIPSTYLMPGHDNQPYTISSFFGPSSRPYFNFHFYFQSMFKCSNSSNRQQHCISASAYVRFVESRPDHLVTWKRVLNIFFPEASSVPFRAFPLSYDRCKIACDYLHNNPKSTHKAATARARRWVGEVKCNRSTQEKCRVLRKEHLNTR